MTYFVVAAVVAGLASYAAAQYAATKRPWLLGVAVFGSIAAVVLGVYAVVALAVDDLVWRLDLLYERTG